MIGILIIVKRSIFLKLIPIEIPASHFVETYRLNLKSTWNDKITVITPPTHTHKVKMKNRVGGLTICKSKPMKKGQSKWCWFIHSKDIHRQRRKRRKKEHLT